MDDPPTFPLFWLPFLVYTNVIRVMNICEQFKFGKISRRARKEVRNSVRQGSVHLHVYFKEFYVLIELENEKMKNRFQYRLWPDIPQSYPKMDLIEDNIKYLKFIFKLDAINLHFPPDNKADLWELIPFLKRENLEIRFLYIEGITLSDELYSYLLRACVPSTSLLLFSPPTSENLDISECPKFDTDDVGIGHASWVTIKHLEECFMDCESIKLWSTQFTPKMLNSFIKKWIQGSFLDDVTIGLKKTSNFRAIVDGITAIPIREAADENSHFYLRKFKEGRCFLIKQECGVEALVYVNVLRGWMTLTTDFSLDMTGKMEHDEGRKSGSAYEIDDDDKTINGDSDADSDTDTSGGDITDEEESEEDESEEEEETDRDTDGKPDSDE